MARVAVVNSGMVTVKRNSPGFNAEGVAYGEAGNVTGAVARRILEACL